MSQYLSFELVNKENPKIKVDLGYWCTSIARGISWYFNNIFPYSDVDVKLDYDTLQSYIETLHDGIEVYRANLRKEQERKRENTENLLRVQSQCAADIIKNDIRMNEESIYEWEEDIETWSDVESRLEFLLDILYDNKDNWDLIYRNS